MKKRATNPSSKTIKRLPASNRQRGQTIVIVALAMLLLIAAIGLAVDGGAIFVQRRHAQNSADAAALAATRTMLSFYESMIRDNPADVDGASGEDHAINDQLVQYAGAHHISRADLEAFYVDDNKQIVDFNQVGSAGRVPWAEGAKGIYVKNRATTNSFFMSVFGWDTVGASAASIAFMGVTTESNDTAAMPIGLYTATIDIDNIQFGQTYTLLDGDVTHGTGNWAWLDFNAMSDPAARLAWLYCGYNPKVTAANWPEWCPADPLGPSQGYGPTMHFESSTTAPYDPSIDPTYIPMLVYGPGSEGWWLAESGGANPECQDFRQAIGSYPGAEGDLLFPVVDDVLDNGGDTRYHLRALVNFHVRYQDITCYQPTPTPTPPGGTPTPEPTPPDSWRVVGTAQNYYDVTSSGKHGDLRHTSGHVVFLDN